MCIIISKPAGVECPSIVTLQTCWEANPDGAGYAVAFKGKVHIRKGFMTWEDFIDSVDFNGLARHSVVFHFRWATHGSTSAGNTHPFPVEGNDKMKAEETRTDVAIAHNGIVRGLVIEKEDYSDTMTYIEKRITPFWKQCKAAGCQYIFSTATSQRVLLNETQSKWSFLFKDGRIINVGDGICEHGCWYSNGGFRTAPLRWTVQMPVRASVTDRTPVLSPQFFG